MEEHQVLTAQVTEQLFGEILDPYHAGRLAEHGACDLAYSGSGSGRFRMNIMRQRLGVCGVCRILPDEVPSLDELGIPPVVKGFATLNSGMVLITGGSGTGKSTTLAAIVNEINEGRNLAVLTLEDPVEFVHTSKNCLVMQRELGIHVTSYQAGLRSALRQDPDVIMVGELRDHESIALAMEASETGHLVLGTLHTRGAAQTIHRIVDAFPAAVQSQVRYTLAENLKAVVSQELIRTADGRGRRAVLEIMVNTPAVAQLVREGKIFKLPQVMATGRRSGMQLLDQALISLVQSGDINPDEAFLVANDKREFSEHVTRPELLNLSGDAEGDAGTGTA
jgi:twitching motility protein PilT